MEKKNRQVSWQKCVECVSFYLSIERESLLNKHTTLKERVF